MDDAAYAAALLAILANPEPSGIDPADPYGQADDGIDRYNGFGREVQVESVELSQGEHGAELDVRFVLNLPEALAEEGVPRRGSVRVPVDREWRELSGYQNPGAHAPAVARKVESAAGRMIERHRSRARGTPPIVPAAPGTHWQALLDELAAQGTSTVVAAPGRIEMRGTSDAVSILVTPEQWEYVVATRAGADIDIYLVEVLAARQADEQFVVFYDGDLRRSIREKLPPVRGQALARKLAERRAANPTAEFRIVAHSRQPPTEAE